MYRAWAQGASPSSASAETTSTSGADGSKSKGTALSQTGSTRRLVADMRENHDTGASSVCPPTTQSTAIEKTCRICLDDEGTDFIAPCACKGTQRYVHRSCRDRWRATTEGLAFTQCNECKTRYKLRCPKRSDDDQYRKWKFRLLVLRDVFIVVLLVQLVVVLMAAAVQWLDIFEGAPLQRIASPWMKAHTAFLYYSFGVLALLVCLGIGACVVSICFRGNASIMEVRKHVHDMRTVSQLTRYPCARCFSPLV